MYQQSYFKVMPKMWNHISLFGIVIKSRNSLLSRATKVIQNRISLSYLNKYYIQYFF